MLSLEMFALYSAEAADYSPAPTLSSPTGPPGVETTPMQPAVVTAWVNPYWGMNEADRTSGYESAILLAAMDMVQCRFYDVPKVPSRIFHSENRGR